MSRSRTVLVMIGIGVALAANSALGDVPLPPPNVPGTRMDLPEALPLVVAGGLLSLTITVVGLLVLRGKPSRTKRLWVMIPATIVALITVCLAIWSKLEYDKRRDWKPLGPVRRFVPPGEPDKIPTQPSAVAPAAPPTDQPK